jgi:hypothetical protein
VTLADASHIIRRLSAARRTMTIFGVYFTNNVCFLITVGVYIHVP